MNAELLLIVLQIIFSLCGREKVQFPTLLWTNDHRPPTSEHVGLLLLLELVSRVWQEKKKERMLFTKNNLSSA